MKNILTLCVSLATLALSFNVAIAEEDAAVALARKSGCLVCHSIQPKEASTEPKAVLPVGPAYAEVAQHYVGKEDAHEQLVTIVLNGSNPYNRHWKKNTSGLAMPPNVALTEENANILVKWILSLAPATEQAEATKEAAVAPEKATETK